MRDFICAAIITKALGPCARAGASLFLAVLGEYVSGIIPPRGCSRRGCDSVFRAMCFLWMFQSPNYTTWFAVCFNDITSCPWPSVKAGSARVVTQHGEGTGLESKTK